MVSVVDIIQRFVKVSIFVVVFSLFYGFRRGRKRLFMVSVVAGERCFMVSVAGFWVDYAAAGGSIILESIERFLVFLFRTGFRRWFV